MLQRGPVSRFTGMADKYDMVAISWPTDLTLQFDTVGHFSDWLSSSCVFKSNDIMVGHSLGGLVALDVARKSGLVDLRVILVESFIVPPPRLFQNLLMPTASPTLVAEVDNMLRQERPRYSEILREQLASLDLSTEVEQMSARTDAVYGDRGFAEADVIDFLGWTKPLVERISIHTVSKACHFPMLEQPVATEQILRSIIDKY